jgi:sugar/nucleoside kinase (ribokinase family)
VNIPFKTVAPKNIVVGVGSALVDICIQESDGFLEAARAQRGGMKLVDAPYISEVLKQTQKKPAIVPGGSACNTILGIGKLGAPARFIGKRGNDDLGSLFEDGLRQHRVEPALFTSSTPTGRVLSIITPDAQRSMLTFLGASGETKPSELTPDLFKNAAIVHLEGYLLFNLELMMAALKAAKDSGALVSLDMASYTVVEASRKVLPGIIREYIDILIANEDEARVYTGLDDERKALEKLSQQVEIAVLKVGKRGSFISACGKTVFTEALGNGAKVVDTTGAGDLWASGFLFGLLQGYPLEKCGILGSACGYEVCKVIGATIPEEGWQRVRTLM